MFIPVLFISLNAFPQNSGITIKKNKPAFPQLAYSNGIMEIQLGKLAQRKASSYKVKEFGERMIIDNSEANKELREVAKKNSITLPGKMLSVNQDVYTELSRYKGIDFDKHYMKKMVEDHKEGIKAFRKASQFADNDQVRNWAQKSLPTLNQHLKLAEKTLRGLKN